MRRFRSLAIGAVLLSAAALAVSASQSPSPNDARPDDPYAISATVTRGQNNFTVRVTITDKKKGEIVSSPAVTLQPGITGDAISGRVDGPEFHTRIVVDQTGKASITFEAYERVLQRSAVSASASD